MNNNTDLFADNSSNIIYHFLQYIMDIYHVVALVYVVQCPVWCILSVPSGFVRPPCMFWPYVSFVL